MSPLPSLASTEHYKNALQSFGPRELNRSQREILRYHYRAKGRKATGTQLAKLMGYKSKDGINLQYGLFATALATALGLRDPEVDSIYIVATFSRSRGECLYTMRPELAAALEELGWT